MPAGRLIAIGDIHGCLAAFEALLERIAPGPDDTLVLLGDYVDRGPDTRGVLDRMLTLRNACRLVPLMGNHELMMLQAFEDHWTAYEWLESGGRQTLASYGGKPSAVPAEHLEFIRSCRPFYETDGYFFVHANYDPQRSLDEQPPILLYWAHLHVIRPGPHRSGKTAVVGHTPQKTGEVLDLGYLLCLDTYCVGGQWLSAMEFPSRRLWQVDPEGRERRNTNPVADAGN
ncbi:MAG: serine/threonine protein phosphatase [Pirellulaceae bacterium]|nr:MAG: serine/threonine protein phosphatase [Pirellulaceae bacterium]